MTCILEYTRPYRVDNYCYYIYTIPVAVQELPKELRRMLHGKTVRGGCQAVEEKEPAEYY